MSIKLNAQSGGSVALDAPTQTTGSADNLYKLPIADGSAGQVLKTDGSGNLSWVSLPTGGLSNAVQFRTTQDQQQDNGNAYETLTNWEKADNTDAGQVGTFADPSSNIFTFPSTGIWRIDFNLLVYNTSNGFRYWRMLIATTTDNSSYGTAARTDSMNANGSYMSGHCCYIMDVTNVSTHKVQFQVRGEDGNIYYQGNTGNNQTHVTFMKLGDT